MFISCFWFFDGSASAGFWLLLALASAVFFWLLWVFRLLLACGFGFGFCWLFVLLVFGCCWLLASVDFLHVHSSLMFIRFS